MKLINEAHRKEYETSPEVIATAPGRFHLIGEHSWFFKDKTLSMAVDLPIYVAISKRDDGVIKIYFHNFSPLYINTIYNRRNGSTEDGDFK